MSKTTVISTDGASTKDRLHLWGDSVWKLIGGLQSDAFGDENFNGHIESGEVGYVRLCRLRVSKHRVVRTPGLISRSDRGYLKIVAQLRGRARFEQGGRDVWLSPGEWSVYDTTQAYSVTNPDHVEQLVLMVPKDVLPEQRLALAPLMVQRFSGAAGVSRLAFETARSAFDEIDTLADGAADSVADAISGLVIQSLLERNGQPTGLSLREALRDRTKDYIRRHLRDPRLSIDQVARALNCSKRHLHNAFADEADTLAGHVMKLRLDACRRDLCDARLRHEPIAEIARSWGFASSAHFSRVFRARFGETPSECRGRGAVR